MASHSLYNLTWGDYGTSLVSAVQLLRFHEELVDVTLAAGGRTFRAHKVVLCAASPFLMELLKSTSCKHPVVMLAGVQAADLEALLEFVYKGEVSIDPNQLPSLLQAAHCLNIQGLTPAVPDNLDTPTHSIKTEKREEDLKIPDLPFQDTEIPIKKKKRVKRLVKSPTLSNSLNKWSKMFLQTESNDNVILTSQPEDTSSWTQQMNIVNVSGSTTSLDALPLQTPILVQNVSLNTSPTQRTKGASDQPGICPLCGATLRQARNLRRHLITSCKYRLLNGSQQNQGTTTTTTTISQGTRIPDGQLQQLQTISLQNIDKITQNTLERLENKTITLTPITCSELISTNSNLVSLTATHLE